MDIRDIKIFSEVARAQNLTRASERVGLSQPALSSWLVKLEEEFGAPLFTRSKKGLHLTEAGARLLEKAPDFNNRWQQLLQYVQDSTDTRKIIFRFGCHESVALYSLSKILKLLFRNHPHIELSFKHDLSRRLTEDIVSDRIDLGIIINPIAHPDLVIKHLGVDQVGFWSAFGKKDQNTLIYDPDLKQSQTLLFQMRKKTSEEPFLHQFTTSSLEVAAHVAAEGLATSILPTRVAKKYTKLQRIVALPTVQDRIALVFKSGFQKRAAARALIDTIVASEV